MAELPPGFVLEGQSPQLPAGFQLEGQQPRVSDEMGPLERMLAMYGRGVAELGQGVKQLGLHAGGALGLADPKDVAAYDKQVKDEAKLYEQDLGQRTGGSVLPMAAQIITTAPIGGVEFQAAKEALPFLGAAGRSALAGATAGAVQPVTEGDYGSQKALQVAAGGGLGAGANALGGVIGHALETAMNPTARILNPVLKRANETPFAKESEQLAADTGVSLTPAQVSGSKTANMAENMARQSIFSRDIAHEGDRARLTQLGDYWDRLVNGVSASDASPEIAGKQVQGAAQDMVKNLQKWRDQTAAEDFGKIREMAKGAPLIKTDTYSATLQSLRDEFGGAPRGSDYARLDSAIGDLMDGIKSQGDVANLMKTRRFLSQVAGGQANIAPDTARGAQKMVASKLLGAIDQDINTAGDTIGGDLGGALKQANARYRELSQQIDSVHASPLGRILGEDVSGAFQSGNFNTVAPETVINKLSSLKPSELGVVRGLMEKDQPQAWQAFKRSYLEAAMERAKPPPSEGANVAPFVPSKLVNNLGDAKKLEAVLSPSEVAQINNVFGVAKRLSDKTGYNFSGTAPAQEALGMLNSALSGGIQGAAKIGATALGSRNLARIMADSDGRAALLQLQRLPAGSAQAKQLTAWLAANYGAEEP